MGELEYCWHAFSTLMVLRLLDSLNWDRGSQFTSPKRSELAAGPHYSDVSCLTDTWPVRADCFSSVFVGAQLDCTGLPRVESDRHMSTFISARRQATQPLHGFHAAIHCVGICPPQVSFSLHTDIQGSVSLCLL